MGEPNFSRNPHYNTDFDGDVLARMWLRRFGAGRPDVEKLCVAADGMSDFWVIRSDFADSDGVKSAVSVRKRILEATGSELGITTDWEKNPVYEHEIIVGKTLRENDGLHIDRVALGETGYIIKEENGKIYIAGGSDKGTALGVEYFLENFVSADTGTVEIPVGFERVTYHKYDMSLYIAGKSSKRADNQCSVRHDTRCERCRGKTARRDLSENRRNGGNRKRRPRRADNIVGRIAGYRRSF